jgi:hypothetical protein
MTDHDIEALFKLRYIGRQKNNGQKRKEISGCGNETIQLKRLILLVSALFLIQVSVLVHLYMHVMFVFICIVYLSVAC